MKQLKFAISVVLLGCLFILNGCSSGGGGGGVSNSLQAPPVQSGINGFSIGGNIGVLTQDGSGNNITVTVPFNTDVTRLVATFTATSYNVYVGNKLQVSGVTENDFTNPVTYVAVPNSTNSGTVSKKEISDNISGGITYTVTVVVASNSAKEITAFSLRTTSSGLIGTPGIIIGQDITVIMPFGTSMESLVATFSTSGNSVVIGNIAQTSGVTGNNFTNPLTYTVVAADGSSKAYTVRVAVAPNSAKDITTFSIGTAKGVINNNNIVVTMQFGTDVTALVANFTTTGSGVFVGTAPQVNDVTPNNFTTPVVYTVVAADGSVQNYTVTVNAVSNVWTWVSGANLRNQYSSYGSIGVPSTDNVSGGRYSGTTWRDSTGIVWFFGGYAYNLTTSGFNSDLWTFNQSTLEWTWIRGKQSGTQLGIYGVIGIESSSNTPGARRSMASWIDANNNLWLFGGHGYDSVGPVGSTGYLNDMWKFNPITKQWTWISGSNLVNQSGSYGIKGVESATNNPGSRPFSHSWVDASGNFWLFGGNGYDSTGGATGYLNDMWKFNPVTKQWTWFGGSNLRNQFGSYGNQGVPSTDNTPGGRSNGAASVDASGNFWLFGGFGYWSGTSSGYLNDLWKFNPSTGEWTWVSGPKLPTPSGQYGSYGIKGVPSTDNIPGGRTSSKSWIDASGNFWLFGGNGYNSVGGFGSLNDLWKFNPSTNEWTWVSGSNLINQSSNYGTKGVQSATNIPGGRDSIQPWIDASGDLWLFGGYGYDSGGSGYLNDIWRYHP